MDNGPLVADTIRLTEQESLANVQAVLQLCASGKLRCSEKTRRPSAATVTVVAEALAAGDFLSHRRRAVRRDAAR